MTVSRVASSATLLMACFSGAEAFGPNHIRQQHEPFRRAVPIEPSVRSFGSVGRSRSFVLTELKERTQNGDNDHTARLAAMAEAVTPSDHQPKKGRASLAILSRFVEYHTKLIYVAGVGSLILEIPKFGLGANFGINMKVLRAAFILTLGFLTLPSLLKDKPKQVANDETEKNEKNETPLLFALALMGGRKKRVTTALATAGLLGIMVSLSEELIFRGVLQTFLGRWIGTNPAILLQSIAFGASHQHPVNKSVIVGAVTGAVGAVFGRIYATSQNLAVPIICHAVYNAVNLYRAHREVTDMSQTELEQLVSA